MKTYTYDDLNRLTDTTRGGVDYQSWDLDAVGNMITINHHWHTAKQHLQ